MALNYQINEQFGGLDSALLYNQVLKSHGYNKEEFLYTIDYYTQEPEKLIKIYDDVFSELSKESEEIKAMNVSCSVAQTINIWKPKKSQYHLIGDTVHYPPVFDIPVDTTGNFVLDAEIKITPKDQSINPRIIAYFYNPENDVKEDRIYFAETALLKCYNRRDYTLTKECRNPALRRMRIFLPAQDNTDSVFYKDFELNNLRVSLIKPSKSE
jgi:hypothetical protein